MSSQLANAVDGDSSLDMPTNKFEQIFKISLNILTTIKIKMDEINHIQQQLTSSATSLDHISKQTKSLVNAFAELKNVQYTQSYLKTLSKSELITIINTQNMISTASNDDDNTKHQQLKECNALRTHYPQTDPQVLTNDNPIETQKPQTKHVQTNEKTAQENALKHRNVHGSNVHGKTVDPKIKRDKKAQERQLKDSTAMNPISKQTVDHKEAMQHKLGGIDEQKASVPEQEENGSGLLESELLKLNMKVLKKKCKSYKVSMEGSKSDMISRIMQRRSSQQISMITQDANVQKEYMQQT
eukprot:259834_1